MKAFTVRDVGNVETGIRWRMMDGDALVPVGGLVRSYITVAPALLAEGMREGVVAECDINVDGKDKLTIVPLACCGRGCGGHDRRALVVLPTGAFSFNLERRHMPVVPRYSNVALAVVLNVGETVEGYPHVRTLGEAESARPVRLSYDGREVTFSIRG